MIVERGQWKDRKKASLTTRSCAEFGAEFPGEAQRDSAPNFA